jgi:hypothetical protein
VREFEGEEDDLMKPIDHTLADTQIGTGYGVTTLAHLAISRSSARRKSPAFPTTRCGSDVFSCRPRSPPTKRRAPSRSSSGSRPKRIAGRHDGGSQRADAALPEERREGRLRRRHPHGAAGHLSSLHFIFRVEKRRRA